LGANSGGKKLIEKNSWLQQELYGHYASKSKNSEIEAGFQSLSGQYLKRCAPSWAIRTELDNLRRGH
jgi:hypothetical protein